MNKEEKNSQKVYSKIKLLEEFENIHPSKIDSPILSIGLFISSLLAYLLLPEISGKEAILFIMLLVSALMVYSHGKNKQLHSKINLLYRMLKEDT